MVLSTDRKSTRLNSSHVSISYAVFCLSPATHTLHSFPTRRSSDLQIIIERVRLCSLHCFLDCRNERLALTHLLRDCRIFTSWTAAVYLSLNYKEPRAVAYKHGIEHRSEEHTSELQSRFDLVCRLLLVPRHPHSTLFPYTTLFRSPNNH